MNGLALAQYDPAVAAARRRLTDDPTIRALLDPALPGRLLERFLIEFSAGAVEMTRPVDGWIRRAGERCMALGLGDVGRSLIQHSRHEAGHHLMLVEDTRVLVARWNEHGGDRLDADALIARPPSPAARRYIELHEATITGPTPWAQVAIELEIEGMSITFGPRLVEQCRRVLGPRAAGLSFIHEHVQLDVGHTAINERMMERLLAARPDSAAAIAAVGAEALAIYLDFFAECLQAARRTL